MSSNLIRRVLVAGVAVPAALAVVYVGGWALAAALGGLAFAGAMELYRLAEQSGMRPLRGPGLALAALGPGAAFAATPYGLGLDARTMLLAGSAALLLVLMFAVWQRAPGQRPLSSAATTVFGVCYASGLLSFLVMLRHPVAPVTAWAGTWLVFLPLAVVWICDSMAMAGGSLIGGPKLARVVSPNKTWAGAIAGSSVSMIVAPVYGWLILERVGIHLAVWQLVAFGLAVSAAGQVGDLAESLFKREAGVKDSGTFFPGHGGVLDRLDSLYFAIPTAVILLSTFEAL